jgi:hypothetical protein
MKHKSLLIESRMIFGRGKFIEQKETPHILIMARPIQLRNAIITTRVLAAILSTISIAFSITVLTYIIGWSGSNYTGLSVLPTVAVWSPLPFLPKPKLLLRNFLTNILSHSLASQSFGMLLLLLTSTPLLTRFTP